MGRLNEATPDEEKRDHGYSRPIGDIVPEHLRIYADELNARLLGHRAGADWYVGRREENGKMLHFLHTRPYSPGPPWRPSADEMAAFKRNMDRIGK